MNRNVLLAIILGLSSSSIFAANETYENPAHALKASTQQDQQNAIDIILEDHRHIRKMIAELDKMLHSNTAESRTFFKQLKAFLVLHEGMEEKTWYPELESHSDLKEIISNLIKEENDAGDAIKKLDDITDDKEWISKVKELNKNVEKHAKDEETKLIPKVRKILDKSSLDAIGSKMDAYKKTNEVKS